MFTSRVFTRSIAAAAAAAVIATGVNTTTSAAPPRSAVDLPIVCTDTNGLDLSLLSGLLGDLVGSVGDLLNALTGLLTGVTRTVCTGLPTPGLPDGVDLGTLGLGSIDNLPGLFTPGVKLLTSPVRIDVDSPLTGLVLVAGATDPATGTLDVLLDGKPIVKDLPLVNIAGLGVGLNLSLPAELVAGGGALTVRYNGTIKDGGPTTSAAKTLDVSVGLLGTEFSSTSGTAVTYPSNPRISGTVVSKLIDTNLLPNLSLLNGDVPLLGSLVTPISPTGTVTAKVGTQTVGSASLNSTGAFSIATTAFPAGTAKSVVLTYGGDGLLHDTSAKTVTVTKAKAKTALTSSVVNKTFGVSSSITVKLSRVTGGVNPTGTVTLKRGTAVLQAKALNSGTATFTLPARQSPGNYGLSVSYAADANYAATSGQTPVRIGKAASRTTASITSVRYGVMPVVSIRVAGLDTLSGSVAVVDGTTVVARGAVTAGKATVALHKQYQAGRRALVVKFAGTLTHGASQSTVVLDTIKATPSVKVVPDTHVKGTVVFRTTVTGVVPVGSRSVGFVGGRVTLSIVKPTIVSTIKVIAVGSAIAPRAFPFAVTNLPKGTYQYRISYSGDINYFSQTVNVRVVVR